METTTRQQRGFATIASNDDRFRLWIPRPTAAGTLLCSCGFSLRGRLPFVDAIDRLGYVTVDGVNNIDEDFSTIAIQCREVPYADCLEQLLEDLPRLMEEELK